MSKKIISLIRNWNFQRRMHRKSRQIEQMHKRTKKFMLGVLAIFKNESLNIEEWVTHYLQQGAGHIFLIDNGSTDTWRPKIERLIASGQVSVISLPEAHQQAKHYWTAYRHFKIQALCDWLLIADLDEFWFCKNGASISDALGAYFYFDVIYANWTIFGSSGHYEHPKSLRKDLVFRQQNLGGHHCRKWIARTSVLEKPWNIGIHFITGACSSRTVSDNTTFQINHYMTQSVEYFQSVKMSRGDVNSAKHDTTRTMAYFDEYDSPCTFEDRLLADLVSKKACLD